MVASETLTLICTLFLYFDLNNSEEYATDVYMHQITFEDGGYFSNQVKITSHYADLRGIRHHMSQTMNKSVNILLTIKECIFLMFHMKTYMWTMKHLRLR